MRNDEVSRLAKEDKLIIELGEIWMVKSYGNKLARNKTSSFRMRLCARLLENVRILTGKPDLAVTDILSPKYFDDVVKVTLDLCKLDEHDRLKHPSVALKVGYDLGRLAGLKLCNGIKQQNDEGVHAAKEFLELIKFQWSTKVSKFAHIVVNEKHFDNHRQLPHPSDITTVAECLVGLAKELKLSKVDQYHTAVQVALPRLMVYNRRRSGEIEALGIDRYQKRTKKVDDVEECLLGELTTLEKYLLDSQEMMWIRGKRGKRVPVLIPPDIKEALEYIANAKVRDAAGVKPTSPYLFANKGHGVYSALQCLRNCCKDKDLIHPDRLTSTGYRAYMATIAQCVGLKNHEVQWLCDHLGHTEEVHRTHYRHTMEGIERIQLGKLLMIQDKNMVQEFQGKGLEEIQFTDIVDQIDAGKKQGPEPVDDGDVFSEMDHVGEPETVRPPTKPVRQKWTPEEEKELKMLFSTNFKNFKCPNTKEIKCAVKLSEKNKGLVHLRKLENIKKKVSNMIIKMKQNGVI